VTSPGKIEKIEPFQRISKDFKGTTCGSGTEVGNADLKLFSNIPSIFKSALNALVSHRSTRPIDWSTSILLVL
jgi:hypothetical protein